MVSLLVKGMIASPKMLMDRHVFGPYSRRDWLFAVLLTLWILEVGLYYFTIEDWTLMAKELFLAM